MIDALPGLTGTQADGQVALADIVVAGNPYHGLMTAGQLEAPQSVKDAATGAGPTEWPHVTKPVFQPYGGGSWAFSNSASAGRSPEQQAADTLIGQRWDNYALICGRWGHVYGSSAFLNSNGLGWLWADSTGAVWRCELEGDDWDNTFHSFNIKMTRFGLFGGALETYTHGPYRLDFAVPLNAIWFSGPYRRLVFQDATLNGAKSAWMINYPVVSVGWEKPGAGVEISLSGTGQSPTVSLTEVQDHSVHFFDHELDGDGNIVHVGFTLFLFYEGGVLKRCSADWSGTKSAAHPIPGFLGIRVDGNDTNCYLRSAAGTYTPAEGDLGGLLPYGGPVPYLADAIIKLFMPGSSGSEYGWGDYSGGSSPPQTLVRLECLDRHIWTFAKTFGYAGSEYEIGTESIAMVHTPATPNGHAFSPEFTASRTAYGSDSFGGGDIAYHRVTGETVIGSGGGASFL